MANGRKRWLFLLVLVCSLLFITGAMAAVSNIRLTDQDDGSLLVRWDDTGSGPYRVSYKMSDWEMSYYNPTDTRYIYLRNLVPGQTYDIRVYPESSSSSSATSTIYTVPYGIFTEYTIGKYLNMTVKTFSLRQMKNDPTATFDIRVSWPKLRQPRQYAAKLCLKTPLGYSSDSRYWDTFEFDNKYAYTYMTYSLKQHWLNSMEDDYGMIPTGKYQFEFYVNNLLYGIAEFTVTQ